MYSIWLPSNLWPLDPATQKKIKAACQALKLCAAKDPWKVIYTKADRNNKAAPRWAQMGPRCCVICCPFWWFQTWLIYVPFHTCDTVILVGGLEHFLFSISYMGCHPSHWRTPSFFRGVAKNHHCRLFFEKWNPGDGQNFMAETTHVVTRVGSFNSISLTDPIWCG